MGPMGTCGSPWTWTCATNLWASKDRTHGSTIQTRKSRAETGRAKQMKEKNKTNRSNVYESQSVHFKGFWFFSTFKGYTLIFGFFPLLKGIPLEIGFFLDFKGYTF